MQTILHRGAAIFEHSKNIPNLNNVSWDDIRIFLACSKETSFRKAAVKLNTSSSTVVRRINHLEETLNLRLFERLPEGIIITDEALLIKESAELMEKSLVDLLHNRSQKDEDIEGEVCISITEGLGIYWLIPRLVDFQKLYPNLVINVKCAMESLDVLRLESDFAIHYQEPKNPDLIVTRLASLHAYPFASEDYIKKHGIPTSDDLGTHKFVIMETESIKEEEIYAQLLGLDSFKKHVGIKTNNSPGLFYAIERGAGIGALPTYALALNAPVIPVDMGIKSSLDIWLTYHPGVKKTPRKAKTIEWIKSIFNPKIYPWFADEFIHPTKLAELLPPEAQINKNNNYFTVTPFGR